MNAVAGRDLAIEPASSRVMRPSAIRRAAARMSPSRARFAGEEIVTETKSLPSVVGPTVSIRTRSDASATSVR
jgi:hypothetical protein